MAGEALTKRKSRSNLAIIVATVLGVALLAGLGTWQLYRLEWKQELIAKRTSALSGEPVTIHDIEAGVEHGFDVDFLRVKLSGRYLPGLARYVYRARGKQAGYQVINPFLDELGYLVFVDRGFITEQEFEEIQSGSDRFDPPAGELTVLGVTRNRAGDRNWFSPEANISTGVWYWYDLPGILASMPRNLGQEAGGLPPVTSALFVQVEPDGEPGGGAKPAPESLTVALPNNHLQYAITWYSLALVLLVMSWLFIRKRRIIEPESRKVH
jgi:surfeit locus 1 family protein